MAMKLSTVVGLLVTDIKVHMNADAKPTSNIRYQALHFSDIAHESDAGPFPISDIGMPVRYGP